MHGGRELIGEPVDEVLALGPELGLDHFGHVGLEERLQPRRRDREGDLIRLDRLVDAAD